MSKATFDDNFQTVAPAEEQKVEQSHLNKAMKPTLRESFVTVQHDSNTLEMNDEKIDAIFSKEGDTLTDNERVLLFEKAVLFNKKGNAIHALLCYLGCLKGLQPNSKFSMLPQCLTCIAKIYADAGDYSKAVQFMQGVKLYYETAIIEAGAAMETYKQETGVEIDYKPLDLDPSLDEAKRANEYEKLSHACLAQHKFQLALEYCGKSTKLRQQVYGDDHAVTVRSLDLFTLIYAEMGKLQYSAALQKYTDVAQSLQENISTQESTADHSTPPEEAPSSRNENQAKSQVTAEEVRENPSDPVADAEEAGSTERRVSDDIEMLTFTQLVLLVAISLISAFLLTTVWCFFSKSDSCPSLHYLYVRGKYWYYYYMKSAATGTSFY